MMKYHYENVANRAVHPLAQHLRIRNVKTEEIVSLQALL